MDITKRYEELAAKTKAGTITQAERREMIVAIDNLCSLYFKSSYDDKQKTPNFKAYPGTNTQEATKEREGETTSPLVSRLVPVVPSANRLTYLERFLFGVCLGFLCYCVSWFLDQVEFWQ